MANDTTGYPGKQPVEIPSEDEVQDIITERIYGHEGDTSSTTHPHYQHKSEKAQPSGYAGLDGDGYVPSEQLGSGGAGGRFLRDDGKWVTIPQGFELTLEGEPGEQGFPGPAGPTGPQGPTGPPGTGGTGGGAAMPFLIPDDIEVPESIAMPGPPGPAGPTGNTGPPGASTGVVGPPGLDGIDAEEPFLVQGPQGPIGPQGPTGAPGSGGGSSAAAMPFLIPDDIEVPESLIPGPTGPVGSMPAVKNIVGGDLVPYELMGNSGKSLRPAREDHLHSPASIGPLFEPLEPEEPLFMPGPAGATGPQGPQGTPGTGGSGSSSGMLLLDPLEPEEPLIIVGPPGAAGAAGAGGSTAYATGSFTVATGNYRMHVKTLQLTTTQRATLAGTGRLSIYN